MVCRPVRHQRSTLKDKHSINTIESRVVFVRTMSMVGSLQTVSNYSIQCIIRKVTKIHGFRSQQYVLAALVLSVAFLAWLPVTDTTQSQDRTELTSYINQFNVVMLCRCDSCTGGAAGAEQPFVNVSTEVSTLCCQQTPPKQEYYARPNKYSECRFK